MGVFWLRELFTLKVQFVQGDCGDGFFCHGRRFGGFLWLGGSVLGQEKVLSHPTEFLNDTAQINLGKLERITRKEIVQGIREGLGKGVNLLIHNS
jgi:hypothetical protein